MTHACCPDCRIRFTPAATAYLVSCPACGEPLQVLAALAGALGYRLFRLEDAPYSLPEAIAVSVPVPLPDRGLCAPALACERVVSSLEGNIRAVGAGIAI